MTVRLLALALLLGGFAASGAQAQSPQDFARCAGIADAGRRLQCYDALAAAPTAEPAPAAAPAPRAAAPAPPPAPAAAGDDFGAEQIKTARREPKPQEPDEIRTRIAGDFEGWEKGTVLTLENGQVWQYVGDHSFYYPAKNPEVTISRGLLGSYTLQVEGANSKARVRRLR